MAYSKAEKAEYDRKYRERNRERLRESKRAYFQATYNPKAAAIVRRARMPQHLEYCKQDTYRAKKKLYDRRKRKEMYGEFSECWLLLLELVKEIKQKQPDRNERYRQSGRYQWNPAVQQRRRRDAKARQLAELNSP